ncbi:hypothetical protein PV326_006419 [Microctonus aethiopoides]|nr:hypothetical protein PV326_006419 [Microctonus aethiopoides]
MNCDLDMPDTQPCENLTQTQSQDVNSQQSQQVQVWGHLIPTQQSSKWGISFQLIQLTKDFYKVGRTNECDIEFNSNSINDNYLRVVSKVHFCIIRQVIDKKNNVVIFIEDNSSNGTFLNKKLIGKGKRCVLDHNDVISVSKASLAELGKGGYGEVMMIYSKSQHKAFAIKIVKFGKMINSRVYFNDFSKILNEVNILKALNNPFIIKMEEVVNTSNDLYIILELMEGGDLYDRINSKLIDGTTLTENQVKFIFYQLVRAVNYLHTNGITHRDLKPENILLASDSDYPLVKITDFGMSKFVDAQTMMKTYCGTPSYVAPEIVRTGGHGAYTNLVDVWSLGVILYVSLTGHSPFQLKDSTISLPQQILKGLYNFPTKLFGHISRPAISLIKDMMTVNPTERKSIRQVMYHSWLLDRHIKFAVDKLISHDNENSPPTNVQNNKVVQQPEPTDNSLMRGIQVFGSGQVIKRPRME